MDGALIGLVIPIQSRNLQLRMWLNVSLRGVRPFFMNC